MRIIRGKYGHRRFDVPRNITARPTTDFARENLFNVLENMLDFPAEAPRALDLFAGTGAVSWELLSRGCSSVTAVEQAPVQCAFIRKTAQTLRDPNLHLLRTDALRLIAAATPSPAAPANPTANSRPFDIVFADPPYDMPGFADIPAAVLRSSLLGPGSIFVMEHSARHDFSLLPHFLERRTYGSVNFSLFRIPDTSDNPQ